MSHIKSRATDFSDILGLGYKEKGEVKVNPPRCEFEMPDFRDLPYDLVDINSDNYNRMANGETVLPIFTAMGCPYQCSFCMSPYVYRKVKGRKWITYSNDNVLDHIEYLLKKYEFSRLQVYDDDSFVDLDRLRQLLLGYIERGFHKKLKLDFRGARINELDKMDDELLHLMVNANVELLAIGAESGSEHSLKLMNKGITVEQTVRVNKKLARFPSLKPHFNFFCGIPGETIEDLYETKELILRLVRDNRNCYLGVGADWKPLPGTAMTDTAVREYGLTLPSSLAGWAAIDSFDAPKITHPWYTKEMNNVIKLLQIAGMLLDRKISDYRKELGPITGRLIYVASLVYKPILLLRLRHNFSSFLIEYWIRGFVTHNIGKIVKK